MCSIKLDQKQWLSSEQEIARHTLYFHQRKEEEAERHRVPLFRSLVLRVMLWDSKQDIMCTAELMAWCVCGAHQSLYVFGMKTYVI